MMRYKKWYAVSIFVIICIVLNIAGRVFAMKYKLPLLLDAFGTLMAAYVLGPVCAAIVGIAVNTIYGILYSYTYLIYGIAGALTGIAAGLLAKRKSFNGLFGTFTAGAIIAILNASVALPCNFVTNGGRTKNVWGDGMIVLVQRLGLDNVTACIAGELYLDFIDRVVECVLLFLLIRLVRKLKRRHAGTAGAAVLIIISALSLFSSREALADDELNFDSYVLTQYNNENGLVGGTANDIAQTTDGILWIGTQGGLYRYNGTEFKLMDSFESVRNVNCLYTDEEGRLWIGTNDSGLSIAINEKVVNVIDSEDGLSSDSVRCIVQDSEGKYYVGTTGGLSVVTLSGGLAVEKVIDEIVYATCIDADENGNVAAVTDDGGLYLINDEGITSFYGLDKSKVYTACHFSDDGRLYVGTSANDVYVFAEEAGGLKAKSLVVCFGIGDIESLTMYDGVMYVCSDSGAGYIDSDMKYHGIDTGSFDDFIVDMLVDYQGNYWFVSSRLGLLCMCPSVFSRINIEDGKTVVNCVALWRGRLCAGTDSGLTIINTRTGTEKTNSLTRELKGSRVRCLMVDSGNNLWAAVSGKGIYELTVEDELICYNSRNGTNGDRFRCIIELSDGSIMAAGDLGITYIADGSVRSTIGYADGMDNPKILCLLEQADGSVLAGSDGGGIYRIEKGKVTGHYTKKDGLGSGVIQKLIRSDKTNGTFAITSRGISRLEDDGSIRELDNLPYYNNYDIVEKDDGRLFVLGAAGIYVIDEEKLLDGKHLEYLLLDSKAGFVNGLTPDSWNYLDNGECLYMSTDSGVIVLDLDDYYSEARSYRMYVKSMEINGISVEIENSETTVIEQGADSIAIEPEVVNYSVSNPYVSVWLEGYEMEPRVMRQSELTDIVYTNLKANTYVFHLAVLDNNGKEIIAESTYTIKKEKEIYDYWWFGLYAIFGLSLMMFYLAWLLFKVRSQKNAREQRRELENTKRQLELVNETVLTIAGAVDARDANTSSHSERVSEYSVMIARRLGFTEEKCESLRKVAMLHDIGKIGIPDRILNKPGRLTDEEYEIMKSHVVKGAEILKNFTLIENVRDGVLYHHERYDGTGYVAGLKGEDIPLNARIIGIADAFDAMTANRVYRQKLDFDVVLGELRRGRGTQFDPKLVDVMLAIIRDGEIDVDALYLKSEKGKGQGA